MQEYLNTQFGLTNKVAIVMGATRGLGQAIAPAYFETDNTFNLRQDQARLASITARIPSGEWGKPEDLAGATVFLASKASNYMNGHIMLVDGGWMAR